MTKKAQSAEESHFFTTDLHEHLLKFVFRSSVLCCHDQIEQDAITAAWEAKPLAACDDAIALLREITDLDRHDTGDMIFGADENGNNDLLSRIATFLATHDQEGTAMTKLTETQTVFLSAGAQRPDNIALPQPNGIAGAAAKMAINSMFALGWLQEVDANLRDRQHLWCETGDGQLCWQSLRWPHPEGSLGTALLHNFASAGFTS